MKKTLFFLVAAIALASCAKNEVTDSAVAPVNSDVIGFNTSTGSTRAANNASADALKSGFNVIGIDAKDGILFANPTTEATASSKFMWNATKWGWEKETDDKKWPSDGTLYPLQFIAAYPLIAEADMGPWATGGAKYTTAIEIDETNFYAEREDLLAANVTVLSKPVSGTVTLNFKHILSNIKFQIISPVGYIVYIESLKIRNVAKSGHTYNYQTSTYDEETVAYTTLTDYLHCQYNGNMSSNFGKYTGLGDDPTKGVTVMSESSEYKSWNLMPQGKTAAWDKENFKTVAADFTTGTWADFLIANPTILNGAMIELSYRMEDADGNSIVGRKKDETFPDGITVAARDYYVTVAYPLDLSAQANVNKTEKGWLPGYSYTYQIKLGTPDATNGTVINPNYKDDHDTDTGIPVENPGTVKPGDDITPVGGYIGFNVIVDEWTDNSSQIK